MTDVVFDSSVSHHTREVYTDIFRDFFNSQEFLLVTKTVIHPTIGEKHKSGLGFSNFEKFTEHFLQFSSELTWDRLREIYMFKGCKVRQFLTFALIDKKIYRIERNNETGVWDIVKKEKQNKHYQSTDLEWLECYNPVDYIDCILPTVKMLYHSRDDSEEFDPGDLIQRMRNGRTPCW